MIRGNPPPKGKRLSAAYLRNQHENDRAAKLLPSDQYSIQTSTRGTVLVLPGNGNKLGVLTITCSACTGTSPHFVWGVGKALLLAASPAGSNSTGQTVTVYNSLMTPLPAAAKPIQLKNIDGMLFVDVKDC